MDALLLERERELAASRAHVLARAEVLKECRDLLEAKKEANYYATQNAPGWHSLSMLRVLRWRRWARTSLLQALLALLALPALWHLLARRS